MASITTCSSAKIGRESLAAYYVSVQCVTREKEVRVQTRERERERGGGENSHISKQVRIHNYVYVHVCMHVQV